MDSNCFIVKHPKVDQLNMSNIRINFLTLPRWQRCMVPIVLEKRMLQSSVDESQSCVSMGWIHLPKQDTAVFN